MTIGQGIALFGLCYLVAVVVNGLFSLIQMRIVDRTSRASVTDIGQRISAIERILSENGIDITQGENHA